jgi:hypothetical protein
MEQQMKLDLQQTARRILAKLLQPKDTTPKAPEYKTEAWLLRKQPEVVDGSSDSDNQAAR